MSDERDLFLSGDLPIDDVVGLVLLRTPYEDIADLIRELPAEADHKLAILCLCITQGFSNQPPLHTPDVRNKADRIYDEYCSRVKHEYSSFVLSLESRESAVPVIGSVVAEVESPDSERVDKRVFFAFVSGVVCESDRSGGDSFAPLLHAVASQMRAHLYWMRESSADPHLIERLPNENDPLWPAFLLGVMTYRTSQAVRELRIASLESAHDLLLLSRPFLQSREDQ